METIWFFILTGMLTIYVIMDGFDFGAGILHLFLKKNENEKKTILRSIGPFWDGNEVWLVASGGVVFIAFPKVYASAFSGFYLALIIVLWLLIGRAVSLELRNHLRNDLWKSFFDKLFGISSLLLAFFFGVALGNVVRGVNFGYMTEGMSIANPGYFFTPLFTDFTPFNPVGVLDWFTILMGLIAVFTLTIHGANWIILKSSDDNLNQKLRGIINKVWFVQIFFIIISFVCLWFMNSGFLENYFDNKIILLFPVAGLTGFVAIPYFIKHKNEFYAFLAGTVFTGGMLLSTAMGLYPALLPSTNPNATDLTIHNSANTPYGLWVAMIWWLFAVLMAVGYFIYVHRVFKGKIASDDDIYGEH